MESLAADNDDSKRQTRLSRKLEKYDQLPDQDSSRNGDNPRMVSFRNRAFDGDQSVPWDRWVTRA